MGSGLQLVVPFTTSLAFSEPFCCSFFIQVYYMLATDPEFGRRGLGSMLLKHVTALADADGKRVYLEATDAGRPLYCKLGCEDIDQITLDLTKWGGEGLAYNWVMMRQPNPKVKV
jgi:GNAT superfamily N-acetyltransferase